MVHLQHDLQLAVLAVLLQSQMLVVETRTPPILFLLVEGVVHDVKVFLTIVIALLHVELDAFPELTILHPEVPQLCLLDLSLIALILGIS